MTHSAMRLAPNDPSSSGGAVQQRMRKINTGNFQRATRSTSRDINRQIVLNLIREHQPISRADLARRMDASRAALTTIVRELLADGTVFEAGRVSAPRGRRPTILRMRTRGQFVAAADVRPDRTSVALADFAGSTVARVAFVTPSSPAQLIEQIAGSVSSLLRAQAGVNADRSCQGVGLVVPGMVDSRTGRVLYAPRLGWRDVDLRSALAARLGLPVSVESAPIACALARLWLSPQETRDVRSFAYVSVSDGVGVGLIMNGEAVRGEAHTAGEFGHVTLDPNGPLCACGKRGCWEAMACNAATVARYERALETAGRLAPTQSAVRSSVEKLEWVVRRARNGDPAAIEALTETGRQIGRGLAAVVSAFNPGRIYIGGEVTAAWSLIEGPLREALVAETLTEGARATQIVPDRDPAEYRLLGAVALVAAPTFAAPSVG